MIDTLLSVRDARVTYPSKGARRTTVTALGGVDLDVHAGEIVGVVGESGSGKSTLGRVTLGLIPTASGTVEASDEAGRFTLDRHSSKRWRTRAQMMFQDPEGSFNPRRTIRSTIVEPLVHVRRTPHAEASARVDDLFEKMGLKAELADRTPNRLSGGQLQRASIARALSFDPTYIVCDEPTSALDASVRAGVVSLLREVRESFGVAYLFISHDLGVINAIADRVVVLYQGAVVEEGPTTQVLEEPQHPYTRKLRSAVPAMPTR